jgi:2-polyprenyl-3-methyl-5-hydroxy-6-metoxy-1,4-benzoquinol methylase
MYAAADPYLNIHKKPPQTTRRLVPILEARAADPQQAAIRERVFDAVLAELPSSITVVDIGCGTGAIARDLARRPSVARVQGIDPGPYLIEEAERLAAGVHLGLDPVASGPRRRPRDV